MGHAGPNRRDTCLRWGVNAENACYTHGHWFSYYTFLVVGVPMGLCVLLLALITVY